MKDPETKTFGWTYFIDTRRCVSFESYHPIQFKNNIPFTLARWICIVENRDVKKKNVLENFKKILYSVEYPLKLIEETIQKTKISHLKFKSFKSRKAKTDSNNLVFVTIFNPK